MNTDVRKNAALLSNLMKWTESTVRCMGSGKRHRPRRCRSHRVKVWKKQKVQVLMMVAES